MQHSTILLPFHQRFQWFMLSSNSSARTSVRRHNTSYWSVRKVQIALTDIAVRTLKPGRYFDEKLPAFGIRIGKHRRTWIAMKGENRNTITLGHYPAISLQDARRRAMAAFVAPEVAKAAITFPEARNAFLALDRWRPLTLKVL